MSLRKIVKRLFRAFYERGVISIKIIEEPASIFKSKEKRVLKLKNKFKGQRCFILGNGPSLNKVDMERLKNEYTFGVNSIFYMTERNGFRPTFYVVEDGHVINDNLEEIKRYKTEFKFIPSIERMKFRTLKEDGLYFLNFNRGFYEPTSPNFESPRFSKRCEKVVYCGQSVTMINLQLAHYMGFEEVYLIGMDFNYEIPSNAELDGNTIKSVSDDENHFDPRYFGAGKKWHDPKLDNVLLSYKNILSVYERDGVKILNATHGGKLEVFERIDFEDIFEND